jgi:protocatechuate 3,4-dioxygenase alpha subunit
MPQALSYLKETASQTAGPYVHIGLIPGMAGFDIFEKNFSNVLVTPDTEGERITLEGRVLDDTGSPLRDVLLEIWQANASGRYHHPADRSAGALEEDFRGWSRAGSDFDTGLITFETIKPGAITDRAGRKCAPHINVWIVARGINIGHPALFLRRERR